MLEKLLSQIAFKQPDSLITIINMFEEENYEENEYLVKENQINDKIFFITSGIIREYSKEWSDKNKEKCVKNTHWILGADEWIFQVKSFLDEKPSLCNI